MEPFSLLLFLIIQAGIGCYARNNYQCGSSSCGKVGNIPYPFRLKDDPRGCGDPRFELTCKDNRTILSLFGGQYYVKSIHVETYFPWNEGHIEVVGVGLRKGNCSSLPLHQLVLSNIGGEPYLDSYGARAVIVSCSKQMRSSLYFNTEPCIVTEGYHSYALIEARASDIEDSCTITTSINAAVYLWYKAEALSMENRTISYNDIHNAMADGFNLSYWVNRTISYNDIHNAMANGFNLSYWVLPTHSYGAPPHMKTYDFCFLDFRYRGEKCIPYYYYNSSWGTALNFALNTIPNPVFVFAHFVAVKYIFGAPCVLILLIYKWMRRHRAMDPNIEEFLQARNNFLPIRYSYSDIRKITKNFKYKLGEGGYGSVYKGILRSGNEVAVKILNKPKSDGQDFISEVGTIGRIHHVNVVRLVGFCFNHSKQALVYDFMPNGSLDKHIVYKDGENSLDYKKMYEISLGIARGIEYLHRGCDMQILHFDIKPHNILLDQSLTPKISDFGLARLYPTDHNIVTLTVARGTLGYMAPELFYRDIGGISYKADVYSFGMMLMEMAGRRRNVNANAKDSSQIYFPLWVYDQLGKEKEVDMVDATEEEREKTRKMIIVALWCIQLNPNDRPSMSRVLIMLEEEIDELQVPPKPLLYPTEPVADVNFEVELETLSSSSSVPTISGSYQHEYNNKILQSCSV